MSHYIIYHNPRCSKSRQTLQLMQENDIEPKVVEYLKNPPSESELADILRLLDKAPRDLLRTGEDEYKTQGFADDSLSDKSLIAKMVQHPKVIERPIVVREQHEGHAAVAIVGRPPENVLEII